MAEQPAPDDTGVGRAGWWAAAFVVGVGQLQFNASVLISEDTPGTTVAVLTVVAIVGWPLRVGRVRRRVQR